MHPEAAQWIADHVDGCKRCSEAMARIDAVRVVLEPPPEPPFMRQTDITAVRRMLDGERRVPWGPMGGAACAGAVAGLVMVAWLRPHRAPAGDGGGFAFMSRQGTAHGEGGGDHAGAEAQK